MRRVTRRFAEVVCPPGMRAHHRTERVLAEFELMLAALAPAARKALTAAFVVLEHGARLYPPARGRRFTRLGDRAATVVGVLEPSVPYPADTEIIANVVTSPHHLSATMVTGRIHRMTELFGRLAPGADLESARAELKTAYAAMVKQHPESYSA